ncbi:MAG TPA: hypothetical protein VEA69_22900 [Tepidisphaeraceae bacterium]|nr:hypothetical protein [Tepidisphaeraceae bacterium]
MRIAWVVMVAWAVVAVGGCGPEGPYEMAPVLVQAVDGQSNEPLAGVTVERRDYDGRAPYRSEQLGVTGTDGLVVARMRAWHPVFVLTRPGYGSAEASVSFADVASVASPADGARRRRRSGTRGRTFRCARSCACRCGRKGGERVGVEVDG